MNSRRSLDPNGWRKEERGKNDEGQRASDNVNGAKVEREG